MGNKWHQFLHVFFHIVIAFQRIHYFLVFRECIIIFCVHLSQCFQNHLLPWWIFLGNVNNPLCWFGSRSSRVLPFLQSNKNIKKYKRQQRESILLEDLLCPFYSTCWDKQKKIEIHIIIFEQSKTIVDL